MIILSLRTDAEQARLAIFDDQTCLAQAEWLAGRQLAETVHHRLHELLAQQGLQLGNIQAMVVYEGPGSFTGLRIGLTTANTLAYALKIPMAGATGDDWEERGITNILQGKGQPQVMPEYGAPVNITLPKK